MLYYQPFTAKVTSLEGEIANLNSQVSTEQTNINKHKPIAEYLGPVKDTFDYLSSFLPKENEIPRLMQIISDLGSQSGARVTMFAPKAPILKEHYAEIEFSMNLEGTFLNNLKFLFNLSQMQRIINIRSVQIENPVMGDNMLMILSFRCEGSTYRLLTPDEAQQVKDSKK
jgi:Tfp pilus assembly protein PilO